MAVDFDGERMIKKMDEEKQPEHPQQPLCACTTFSCNKIWLLIYSLFYVLIGSGLLLLGVWIELQVKDFAAMNDDLFIPAMIMIAVGFVIILNSILGITGVLKENICLLRVFLLFIELCFAAQIAIGVLAFVYGQDVPVKISENFMFLVKGYSKNNFYKRSMDNIQASFGCCGLESYMDYDEDEHFQCNSEYIQKCGVPWTCCKKDNPDDSIRVDCGYQVRYNDSMLVQKINTMGCTETFLSWLSWHLDLVGIAGLGTAIPQIIGILLVYFFMRQVREMKMWYRVGA